VNLHPHACELVDGVEDVDGVPTEPVQFGDHQHVTVFQPIEQMLALALDGSTGSGDSLFDNPVRFEGEPGAADLLHLFSVVCSEVEQRQYVKIRDIERSPCPKSMSSM
jgi:hypothetical protein